MAFAVPALADTYDVTQKVIDKQFAINVVDINYAQKVTQVAQNVGNTAIIKDLDAYGGDSFDVHQEVTAMQFAKNTVEARNIATKIDQTAVNFGSDLLIKDTGGSVFSGQTVDVYQYQAGMQHAINTVDLYDPVSIVQVAANTGNNADINLPSSTVSNSLYSAQSINAPQVAGNFVNVGYVGTINQTAANLGNAIKIVQ